MEGGCENMCNPSMEYDATASWSGYTYQGKVAIYITLKKINYLRSIKPDCSIENYYLELEWMEDFSILYRNDSGVLVYESIHQVKARQERKLPAYSSALIKLLQKVEADGNIQNAFLHTMENVDYQNNWLDELKIVSVDDKEVKEWIDDINSLLGDSVKKSEFVHTFPKKRSDFSKQFKKYSNKITLENIDEILGNFKSDLEVTLNKIQQGFSDESLKKVILYSYDNGQKYCPLDEIDNLIKAEIINFWNTGTGDEWKIEDTGFQEIILRCLTGIIDSHIMKRHRNYGSKDIEKLNFCEFEEILKSDAPIKRCKEYYLYTIKEKLLEYCDEYEKICYEDCSEDDNSPCTLCQLNDFKHKVLAMNFDEIWELVIVTNPDIASNFDERGFIDYCGKNRYFNPFYNGIKEIIQKYGKEKIPVSYIDRDKKLYLLTTICDNGVSRKPIKEVCKNIIENTALSHVFMDYEVIISKDLESSSILSDAGDYLSNFKREEHNIYHFKNVSMKKLENCKQDLNF